MTPDQIAQLAHDIADGLVAPDMVDWDSMEKRESDNVLALAMYILRERASERPQRVAMALFRSWLTPAERRELSQSRRVTLVGASGTRYRLYPETGNTQRAELHGTRWFAKSAFCLHPDVWIPPADVALAHYLSIQTDEAAFLAAANEHRRESGLWDGAYLRRINAARRARAA